jgi:hypothetical protein
MRRACWIVAVLATAVLTGWAEQPPAPRAQGPVTVASGATKIARWELYVSAPRPGRRCVGMRIASLFDESNAVTRERCGPRRLAPRAVTLHTLAREGIGAFAFGRTGGGVREVELRVAGREPVRAMTLQASSGGRFWVVNAGDTCGFATVRALVRSGKRRSGRIGSPGCG